MIKFNEPQPEPVMPVGFPDITLPAEPASVVAQKRVLVAYASTTGSTGGVAEGWIETC